MQLEPDEPAEIEIFSIDDLEGNFIDLTDEVVDEILPQLFELRVEREQEENYHEPD